MKKIALFLLVILTANIAHGQTKADIFGKMPITWLGVDFTQLKFIGTADQFKDAGQITNSDMRNKYFPGWNNLFVSEEKKYNVADAVNRDNVKYAIDVTGDANSKSDGNYFTPNASDYQLLTADKISSLISKYDFKGNMGLGMLFFVDGMSKDKEEASIWITFVNMEDKTVLLTKQVSAGAGGFGFRNYWAKSFFNVLKDMNLKKMK